MRNKILLLGAAAGLMACSSVLDVPPTSSIPSERAITDAVGARAALEGAYAGLQTDGLYGLEIIDYTELLSDNARHTGTFDEYADAAAHRLLSDNGSVSNIWNDSYNEINRINEILQKVPGVPDLDDEEKSEILGEAYFHRALMYHDMVRLWGGVPLRLEPITTPEDASTITRSTTADTYAQILSDLAQANQLITAGRTQTRHASLGAVYAIEARVKLYQQDWAGAEAAAAQVEAMGYTLAPTFGDLFDPAGNNTPEDILRVTFTSTQANSVGFYYLPKPLGGRYEIAPSRGTAGIIAAFDPASAGNISAYNPTDARGIWSISLAGTRTYASKFRNPSGEEDIHVIRLGEVILIRAEALAQLGRLPEAIAEYNRLRIRAGLAPDPVIGRTQADVLAAIARERRLELAFEGDRWPDMVRTGIAPSLTGSTTAQSLLPIPQGDLDTTPGLTQNPGY